MPNRELMRCVCYEKMNSENCEKVIKQWYYFRTNKVLNLDNPISFNEKIQWLKLYDSTPEKTKLADKHLVREWVKDTVGEEYLIPSFGVWDSVDDIDFDALPKSFVLKANHGSRWNMIVKDKDSLNIEETKRILQTWLASDYGSGRGLEMHYMHIKPRIIAQAYIEEISGNRYDYRFFCFSGKPEFVWYDIDVGNEEFYRYYDMEWNLLDYRKAYPGDTGAVEKPKNYEKMVEIATKLSAGFATVRVDLYNIDGKIYFCEMTFTSNNGAAPWKDEEQDEFVGNLITLPSKSPLPDRIVGEMVRRDAVSLIQPKISLCFSMILIALCVLQISFALVVLMSVMGWKKDLDLSVLSIAILHMSS